MLFWGILVGSVAAWLSPCLIAWVVALISRLPNAFRFAIASAVLTYGTGFFYAHAGAFVSRSCSFGARVGGKRSR